MRLRGLLVGVLLLLAGAAGVFGWLVLTPAPALQAGPLVVDIPAHEGLAGIADRLSQAGVVRSRAGFLGLVALKGSMRRLKAGEYEIPRDASTLDVLDLLESGRVRQHVILHPEGATVSELARLLETERLARAEDVMTAASSERLRLALGVEGPSLEGYLFPDTYQFVRGMSVDEMLTRMVQRMRGKLTPEVQARAKERGLSVHQLLTLASIIEREAVDPAEQRLISAVFWNRLRLDMPLQADPTVQYAVAKERRPLTRADLAREHPFNTYVHRGLPPGPIASPGAAAIEAALDPAPVKFLYFVARDDRRHYFSTSVAEHNAAVARYRQARRQL
ncbi:MAG TPA: endolytic transglycosylase MltG [Candidatus Binatia bacterium]|nr:endolytic transglycosylase MltG [Candidatus Binatia bacterium]